MVYGAVCVARGVIQRSRRGVRVNVVQSCEISVYRGQRRKLCMIISASNLYATAQGIHKKRFFLCFVLELGMQHTLHLEPTMRGWLKAVRL